jgi:hypothetical protein
MKMKNFNFKFLGAALMLSIALLSCKKDETLKKNNFTYDSKSYDTPKGFLDFYGPAEDNKSSSFDLIIVSSGISLNLADTSLIGTGDYFYAELNSASLTGVSSDTYTWDPLNNWGPEGSPFKPKTFTDSGIGIGTNANGDETVGNEYYADSSSTGTIIIKKSGSTYEITYSVVLETGKKVEGYYNGTLQYVDDSGNKKSTQTTKKRRLSFKK